MAKQSTPNDEQYERLKAREVELSERGELLKEQVSRLILEGKPAVEELKAQQAVEAELIAVRAGIKQAEELRSKQDAFLSSPEALKARKEVEQCRERAHKLTLEALERMSALRKLADDYNVLAKRAEDLRSLYHIRGGSLLQCDDGKYIGALYQFARRYATFLEMEQGERKDELSRYRSELKGTR